MRAARCFCFVIFKATKALITVIQYVPGPEGGAESLLNQGAILLGCGQSGDMFGTMPDGIQRVRAERGLRTTPLFLIPTSHLNKGEAESSQGRGLPLR